MARLSIRITHVAWRDGRPRFNPGPRLRALGFKGEDLKTPAGAWMSAEQALAWSTEREAAIAARTAEVAKARAQRRKAQALPAAAATARYTSVEDLFEQFFKSPRMTGETVEDGRRRQKPAAPKTIRDYRLKANAIGAFDGDLWTGPVEQLMAPGYCYDLYERLWTAKGLSMARGMMAVLSAAVSWGRKRGRIRLAHNPCLGLGMEMPEPRLRALTPAEVRHLVATADAQGRPEIGDAIALGVWTGQRQGDRIDLVDAGLDNGRRIFKQAKTQAIVAIPQAPELEARLAAAKARRAGWTVVPRHVVVDEAVSLPRNSPIAIEAVPRLPFRADHYRHLFAAIRAAAAKTMPTLADVRDQDLRDTAVTWLARAGCSIPEVCAITGHSAASAHGILKHYLAAHPELADNAIKKLVAWYDGEGAQG